MLSTWCERCYLLAVVLPLRDSAGVGVAVLPIVSFTCAPAYGIWHMGSQMQKNKICEMLNGA